MSESKIQHLYYVDSVLDKPIEETGGIWIANSDESPIWRYEFLSTKPSEVT